MFENLRRMESKGNTAFKRYYLIDGRWNLLLNFRDELAQNLSKAVDVYNNHSGDNGIKFRITDEAPWWNDGANKYEVLESHKGLWVNVSTLADLKSFWLVAEALCSEPFVDIMCGEIEFVPKEGENTGQIFP